MLIFQKPQKNININKIRVSLAWIWNSWLAPTASNTLSHRRSFFLYLSHSHCTSTDSTFFFSIFFFSPVYTRFSIANICGKYHCIVHKFTSNYSRFTSLYPAFCIIFVAIILLPLCYEFAFQYTILLVDRAKIKNQQMKPKMKR